jgi:CBS domain-containing protein
MQTEEIMTTTVIMIGPPATVRTASKLMREKGVGSLIVTEDNKAVGIITERDILTRVTSKKIRPSSINVGKVMSSPLICISPETDILDAAKLMIEKNIRRLPISDKSGSCIGIVTERDIMKGLLKILSKNG